MVYHANFTELLLLGVRNQSLLYKHASFLYYISICSIEKAHLATASALYFQDVVFAGQITLA